MLHDVTQIVYSEYKGKGPPRKGQEGPDGSRYIAILFNLGIRRSGCLTI